jgi:STE24 endopeptidase
MSTMRAVAIIMAVSLGAAAAVALASRTPASVRAARPDSDATDPTLGARFSDAQISRHASYRGPSYLSFALTTLLEIGVLIVLARGPFRRLVEVIQHVPGGWPVHAALLGMAIAIILAVATLPLGYVRGYAMEQAWGLSTQDIGGWLSDRARSTGVVAVTGAIAAMAFFGIVRWQPRTWWVWGWVAFSALTAALVFLYPIVIAPLFNKFTPLQDATLERRVTELAQDAGVHIDEVLVADASRRTTAENAYVAGLGETKRLVLYDTLLEADDEDATAFVVAHELGHRAEGHVWKNVALASAGLLVGFALLYWLAEHSGVWSWAGAFGVADLRALPILLLFASVVGLVALPAENWVSRRFEARADEVAVELTNDPATAVRVFRRLAFSNLADLRPPDPVVWALYSHPPIQERIEAAVAESDIAP